MNSLFLSSVGPEVEAVGGRARLATVYGCGALGGGLASYLLTANPSVGASGALFGLVGALLVFSVRHDRTSPLFNLGGGGGGRGGGGGTVALRGMDRYRASLVRTVGINLLYGLASPRVDNWGHLGGLAGGAAAGWLLGPRLQARRVGRETVVVDSPPLKLLRGGRVAGMTLA